MTCHTCHPATSAKQITQLFINRKLILTLLKGGYQLIFSRMKVIRNTWQTWQRGKNLLGGSKNYVELIFVLIACVLL